LLLQNLRSGFSGALFSARFFFTESEFSVPHIHDKMDA